MRKGRRNNRKEKGGYVGRAKRSGALESRRRKKGDIY